MFCDNLTNFLCYCAALVFICSLTLLFINSVSNSFTFPLLTAAANLLKRNGALLVIDIVALLFIADAADLFINSTALLFSIVGALLGIDCVSDCGTLLLVDVLTLRSIAY